MEDKQNNQNLKRRKGSIKKKRKSLVSNSILTLNRDNLKSTLIAPEAL